MGSSLFLVSESWKNGVGGVGMDTELWGDAFTHRSPPDYHPTFLWTCYSHLAFETLPDLLSSLFQEEWHSLWSPPSPPPSRPHAPVENFWMYISPVEMKRIQQLCPPGEGLWTPSSFCSKNPGYSTAKECILHDHVLEFSHENGLDAYIPMIYFSSHHPFNGVSFQFSNAGGGCYTHIAIREGFCVVLTSFDWIICCEGGNSHVFIAKY